MIAVMIVVSIVNEIVAACYSSDSPVFPCGMEVEVNNELRLLRKTHQHLRGSLTPCYHFPFFFFKFSHTSMYNQNRDAGWHPEKTHCSRALPGLQGSECGWIPAAVRGGPGEAAGTPHMARGNNG